MLNLLYCFDENYNKQTYISIYSILRQLEDNQKISVYIIHKNPTSFDRYIEKLEQFNNLENITIYKFTDTVNFPFLDKAHVSEATYYRLMIEKYIPDGIDSLIYLDSDVIALNNPYYICESVITNLTTSRYTVAVSTEMFNSNENIHFQNIDLTSYKYFNAGVMFIDYTKWKEGKLMTTFLNKVDKYKEVIKLWDQDILNNHFNGEYYEISSLLNFRLNTNNNLEYLKNTVIFYHFSGDHKPWQLKGSLDDTAKIFFEIYSELESNNYFFQRRTGKSLYLKTLLGVILSRRFRLIDNKFKYLKEALKEVV